MEREFYIVEVTEEFRDFSTDKRKALAKKGQALPDGSYPIQTVGDLHNAIQAYGRAKNAEKVKAHIIARAKALGAESALPSDWGVTAAAWGAASRAANGSKSSDGSCPTCGTGRITDGSAVCPNCQARTASAVEDRIVHLEAAVLSLAARELAS